MVERHDGVVEAHLEVRNVQVVTRRCRELFEGAHGVVGQAADHTPGEWGRIGKSRLLEPARQAAEVGEWVRATPGWSFASEGRQAVVPDDLPRVASQKGITADPLPSLHGL